MTDNTSLESQCNPIVIDSSVLNSHNKELDAVFKMYIEDINPFIARFETAKNEFPIEITNEIRSIYGHLIRATMTTDEAIISQNLDKIKSHSKRALLDCFKYTSIAFSDYYDSFMDRYKNVDLTYIEEGKFLQRVVVMCNNARRMLKDAKIAETSNLSAEELFLKYQAAYREFEKLNAELENAEDTAAFLQRKATKKEKLAIIAFIIGIIGTIAGIASVILYFI